MAREAIYACDRDDRRRESRGHECGPEVPSERRLVECPLGEGRYRDSLGRLPNLVVDDLGMLQECGADGERMHLDGAPAQDLVGPPLHRGTQVRVARLPRETILEAVADERLRVIAEVRDEHGRGWHARRHRTVA